MCPGMNPWWYPAPKSKTSMTNFALNLHVVGLIPITEAQSLSAPCCFPLDALKISLALQSSDLQGHTCPWKLPGLSNEVQKIDLIMQNGQYKPQALQVHMLCQCMNGTNVHRFDLRRHESLSQYGRFMTRLCFSHLLCLCVFDSPKHCPNPPWWKQTLHEKPWKISSSIQYYQTDHENENTCWLHLQRQVCKWFTSFLEIWER